jgi:hypothetical protein
MVFLDYIITVLLLLFHLNKVWNNYVLYILALKLSSLLSYSHVATYCTCPLFIHL